MKAICFSLCTLGIATLISSGVYSQTYSKMKITLKDGSYIEGKKGVLDGNNASLYIGGTPKSYALTDVNTIMAKKNKVGAFAAGFGGGCAGICLIAIIANSANTKTTNTDGTEKASTGTLIAGSLIWTVIFAGIGAGVGALASPWKMVYSGGLRSSVLQNMNVAFYPTKVAPYNVGVVYKIQNR